jgi:succinate dehydrogenase/fumarate reductase flavoprotein subunit
MANDRLDVSDKTAISMPMRNLLAILSAVGVGVWAFFGIQERLNTLETRNTLMEADLVENTAFRIGWPRGEMGSLPADSEQFMLIEYMSTQLEKMQKQVEAMMHNAVNITRLQQDMQEARDNIEKLKDKLREANGG